MRLLSFLSLLCAVAFATGVEYRPLVLGADGKTRQFPNGSDSLRVVPSYGAAASKPAASADNVGQLYIATDTTQILRSNGTTWDVVGFAGTAGGDLAGTYPNPQVAQSSYAGGFAVTDTTASTSSTTGALRVGNGVAATSVGIGAGVVYAGAGINAPAATLTGTAATPAQFLTMGGTTTAASWIHGTNTGAGYYLGVERDAGGFVFTGTSPYATIFGTSTATPLQFGINNAIVSTINSSGELLVGTTTDDGTEKLQVLGGALGSYFRIRPAGGSVAGSFEIGSDAAADGFYVYDRTPGAYRLVVNDGGETLLGGATDLGAFQLQVHGPVVSKGTSTTMRVTSDAADYNTFQLDNSIRDWHMGVSGAAGGPWYLYDNTLGQTRMQVNSSGTILADGRVSLGTYSPSIQTGMFLKQAANDFASGVTLQRSNTVDAWQTVVGGDNNLYLGYANAASGADESTDFNAQMIISSAGILTPTSYINAPAATTSIPSIRLPHGTAPSSPTNGDVWTTSAGIYVQINGSTVGPLGTGGGGSTPTVVSRFNGAVGSAVTTTTTETSLLTGFATTAGSLTLGAGTLTTGASVRIRMSGYVQTDVSQTLRLRAKAGASTYADTGALTVDSTAIGGPFNIAIDAVIGTAGASANVRGLMRMDYVLGSFGATAAASPKVITDDLSGTVDTTGALALDVTAQWGSSSGSNSISLYAISIETLMP